MIDIQEVGTGGGSIARAGPAGMRFASVPESAGAEPGPVCYGLGGVEYRRLPMPISSSAVLASIVSLAAR